MPGPGVYTRVAQLWGVVFALVGLAFGLARREVAAAIEAVGGLAHMSGSHSVRRC